MSARPQSDRLSIDHLLASPWFAVLERPRGSVQVTRTDRGFASAEEIERAHTEMEAVLDALERERRSILVDLRRAPSRNDPEFEQAMVAHRQRMFARFRRRAVLVRSAVGGLQVRRHARQDGHGDLEVFTDLEAALTALADAASSPPRKA